MNVRRIFPNRSIGQNRRSLDLAVILVGIILTTTTGMIWAIHVFGSLNHAWLYAKGVRVFIDNPSVQLQDGRPGEEREATFLVHNLASTPIHILGVKTSCGCVADSNELPETIPPRGNRMLNLKLHLTGSITNSVKQEIIYNTDEPTARQLLVVVKCRVVVP